VLVVSGLTFVVARWVTPTEKIGRGRSLVTVALTMNSVVTTTGARTDLRDRSWPRPRVGMSTTRVRHPSGHPCSLSRRSRPCSGWSRRGGC